MKHTAPSELTAPALTRRADRLVTRWAAIYTAGLPASIRDARTAELRSDLWEQRHDPEQHRTRHVVARFVKGVPADLLWRLETRYQLGGLMKGTALLVTRIGSAIAAIATAFWLFWALLWGSASLGGLAALFAVVATVLWWAGTTAEIRDRRRRLAVGSAITAVGIVVVVALLSVGASG